MKVPLTAEAYFAAPMIADPHCLFDFCLETDGAIAVVVTSAERARDLRRRPVPILGSTHGSGRDWGRSIRSEEHTSELQSLMRISYAVFCLNKKPRARIRRQQRSLVLPRTLLNPTPLRT